MKVENHRLKNTLEEMNTNYNALQMHLVSMMQDQKTEDAEKQEVFDGKLEEKKQGAANGGGVLVPRQFMDLGLASNVENDEPSSSSLGRSQDQSGSAGNNMEVGSKELATIKNGNASDEREDSPSGQGCGADKVPRSSLSKNNVDQAEATMRKARVSVRARSEAPMVCQRTKTYCIFENSFEKQDETKIMVDKSKS